MNWKTLIITIVNNKFKLKRVILKAVIFFLLLFFHSTFYAQIQNDNCNNAFEIDELPFCTDILFSNLNSTPDFIGANNGAACFLDNPPNFDVWFSFTASQSNKTFTINISGNAVNGLPIRNIQAAVYRGSCGINNMVERDCAVSGAGISVLNFDVKDLTPGEKYYLRVDNYGGAGNSGEFNICIREKDVFNVNEDDFSDNCSGILYDSGGDDGDYGLSENHTFTICPQQEPGNDDVRSIILEFEYYQLPMINKSEDPIIEMRSGDFIKVFSGPDTTYAQVLIISGNEKFKDIQSYNFGGGVAYVSCINSPCITVQFFSDDSLNAKGFKLNWNCSYEYCDDGKLSDLVVKNSIDDETLLSNFVNNGIEAKITNIACDKKSYGIYQNFPGVIEMENGLVMSNGLAEYVKGSNLYTSRSYVLNTPGDPDLDSLSYNSDKENWQRSVDACVIEMEVIPLGEEISYNYLFGSEEYPEYANSQYNDIFALFISGKDIIGDNSLNGQVNMAKIPGTKKDVEINSVNHINNWQYYHSNLDGKYLEYDGFVWDSMGTKKYLTARQKVIPCETYRIKFAIADRGDTIYDSGVFISDLRDGRPEIFVEISNSDFLIDNCDLIYGKITFRTELPVTNMTEYQIEVSGTAKKQEDYILEIPEKLIFEQGESLKTFLINVIVDDIKEGTETINISLFQDLPCGRKLIATKIIEIRDKIQLSIDASADTINTCRKNELKLKAIGSEFVNWQPDLQFKPSDSLETVFYPDSSHWIFLYGRLFDTIQDKCLSIDSVFVEVNDLEFKIKGDSIIEVCNNSTVRLKIGSEIGNGNLEWMYTNRLIRDEKEINIESINQDLLVYAIYSEGDCVYFDSVQIRVIPDMEPVILLEPPDKIYYGDTILISAIPNPDFENGDSLTWSINGTIIENENQISYIINTEKTLLQLILNYNGYCPGDTILEIEAVLRNLYFPEAVILNEDENDHFRVYNHYNGMEIIDLSVFNRWGEMVFNCTNLDCARQGWDGKLRNGQCTPGVYIFSCAYKEPYGKVREIKGSFVLLE